MNKFFMVLVAGLSLVMIYPLENKSWIGSFAPILLGFLAGLLNAETPMASSLQELFGLTSRHPDRVGLDIIHTNGENIKDRQAAKSQLNQRVMYGLQHAFLNLEVTGWWFNMGYWNKETRTSMRFQDACKALVEKLTSHLDIGRDSHILDVGFGCGDQDVYMAQLYRPARITGITIEPIQHHAAQELIRRTQTPETDIQLHVADASKLPAFLQANPDIFTRSQPQFSSSSESSDTSDMRYFTHVVSIDSAYHYNTRVQFLKNAAAVLMPETGRLALADMILARPAPTSGFGQKIFNAVFSAIEVPVTNMKTIEAYKQDLVDAGFVDIEIECIEEFVFSGLASYIDNQLGRLGGLVKPGVNWTYWGLSKGLWWLDRSKWLHFVIVKARNGHKQNKAFKH